MSYLCVTYVFISAEYLRQPCRVENRLHRRYYLDPLAENLCIAVVFFFDIAAQAQRLFLRLFQSRILKQSIELDSLAGKRLGHHHCIYSLIERDFSESPFYELCLSGNTDITAQKSRDILLTEFDFGIIFIRQQCS